MRWPENPEDSKSLFISIIGGLVVAIIILAKDVMDIIFSNKNRDITLIALFILLFIIFIIFLYKYSKIRDGLDDISIKSRKKKK